MNITEMKSEYTIYLDQDGVLADFDKGVQVLTGKLPHELGKSKMWKAIYSIPNFFDSLEWMPDGRELWEYTRKHGPTVLTGLPSKNGAEQKRMWVARHMGPSVPVIVLPAKEKQKYANDKAVLVDDKGDNIARWTAAGGIGILHRSAAHSILELQKLGL